MREELYRKFGPKLVEALVLTFTDEINAIRKEAKLPERAVKEIESAVAERLDKMAEYSWMIEINAMIPTMESMKPRD